MWRRTDWHLVLTLGWPWPASERRESDNRKYSRPSLPPPLDSLRWHFLDLSWERKRTSLELVWRGEIKRPPSLTFHSCKIPAAGRGGIGQGREMTTCYELIWVTDHQLPSALATHHSHQSWLSVFMMEQLWARPQGPAPHTRTQTSGNVLITSAAVNTLSRLKLATLSGPARHNTRCVPPSPRFSHRVMWPFSPHQAGDVWLADWDN